MTFYVNYTYAQVSDAVNAGADLLQGALDLGEMETDVINLVVNAAMACLKDPCITFDEMVADNYSATPDEVRGWWDGWS